MTALYEDDLVSLHHADYCDVVTMDMLQTVDLAIVDPPYGDTSLDWDRIDRDWLPRVFMALKDTGVLWLWGSMRYLATAALPMAEANGWKIAQDVVWEKHNGSGSAADRFRRVHEHAVMLYKTRAKWADVYVDPQRSADATARQVRRKQRPTHWGEIGEAAYSTEDGGPRLMRSVMYERSDHGRAIHPTQKPVGIMRTLIQYSCPPGGLVLDPFAGSATTLVAARQCGRRAVGCERDEDYAEAAAARLAQAVIPV